MTALPRLPRNASRDQIIVHDRQKLERQIAFKLIEELLAGGYELAIDDGEGIAVRRTRDEKTLREGLFSVDEEHILVYKPTDKTRIGWVFLVYGNDGYDVINDYAVSIEDHITETNKLAERLAKKAR